MCVVCLMYLLFCSDVAESTFRSTFSFFTYAFANMVSEGFVFGGKGVVF